MEFENRKWRKRMSQSFDKEKITLTMAGKTFNLYDKIQEGREDTEIYPTLEKYGCLPNEFKSDAEVMNYLAGHVQEFDKKYDLRDVSDQKIMAEKLFYNLPLNIRNKFDNDIKKLRKERS